MVVSLKKAPFVAKKIGSSGEITSQSTTGADWETVAINGDLPTTPPLEAVMFVVPAVTGVTNPVVLTVATEGLLEVQVIVAVMVLLFWSSVSVCNCCFAPPAVKLALNGETKMVVSVAACVINGEINIAATNNKLLI